MTPAAIERWKAAEAGIDPGGMRELVAGLPRQIAGAVGPARAFAAGLDVGEAPRAILVLGMGGSAIAGDLVTAFTEESRRVPMEVVRDYAPPAWAGSDAVAIASSYSGNTEETLASRDAARERGMATVAVTKGGALGERARAAGEPVLDLPTGYPPRAALGWSFAACALIVARLDPGLDVEETADRIEDAAAWLEREGAGWLEWEASNPALAVAADLAAGIGVIHGGNPVSTAAAYRWKCQLNENAKRPAFHAALPEHNHNEIVGWEASDGSLEPLVPVFLGTAWDHPRTARRMAWARNFMASRGARVHRFEPPEEDRLAGLLWLCWLGDCASFLASVIAGRDPSPVQSIDTLKAELGREGEAPSP